MILNLYQCTHIIECNYQRIHSPPLVDPLENFDAFFIKDMLVKLANIPKCIRESISNNDLICRYKIGLNLDERTARTWLYNLSKITSSLHKNCMLLAAHGALNYRERSLRFGLIDTPLCLKCDEIETLKH